ncbi:hypothetical protein E4U22_004829 [Claviceps purpurea]|uniref:DUF2423 domain-containing protein n=2 Tax=Claviceps TaxID=5110 RepID=M1WIH2_CLAP2|nr:hypothetical protein E4U12_005370 [Claviceps purpurea]KAG6298347.1 hypothetical protein E4U09_000879 [Claviceps aff. purpurea]CCE34474.1 uncharacterized protein CPUR_08406 [Claviceps purpurea 20.1]KAG6136661.1 hypothetical protein E4U28_004944 [Claviceps purpurea]KAG6142467.1 hypothetical protein E4U38_005377 [Claviceps purpurea]
MAKSARSSTKKANNRRLYAKVFSPAEAARNERLSAKLLELAKQPKPESSDANMDVDPLNDMAAEVNDGQDGADTAMDVDSKPSKSRSVKKGADKRKQRRAGIVFKKYSDRVGAKKKKSTRKTASQGGEMET